jgi:hypothetical protein
MSNDPWREPERFCWNCNVRAEGQRCPVCRGKTDSLEAEEQENEHREWNAGFEHALTGALPDPTSVDYANGFRAGKAAREMLINKAGSGPVTHQQVNETKD